MSKNETVVAGGFHAENFRRRSRYMFVFLLMLIAFVIISIVNITSGNVHLSVGDIARAIFYREGEEIVLHGANPYVVRYYIKGKTREEIDALTEKFFREMSITDANGIEVLYRNQIGK